MLKNKNLIFLLLLLMFCSINTFAQTTISGTVYDSENNEPLPFVNVVFKHSTVGTITDINGTYHINTNKPSDTLIATSLGYTAEKVRIKKNSTQTIDFRLSPSAMSIEEVIVTPGENPAFRILREVKSRKKINNPDQFNSYQYKTYNKLRLDLNNIDGNFKKQRLLKQFQFVFDHMDTSEVFGKNYLPILISESVSNFYFQKNPSIDKEVIEAFKVSGIENNSISQFSGKMYQRLNVYDNFITLFEPGFVSPIADFGRMYYKYRLEDSASIDDSWCYKISFKPKRSQERTFYGYFWVADTTWAIKKIQLRVSKDVNINFMNDLVAINEYQKLNDSTWFLKQEDLLIDFNISDKTYGFFGRKQAIYDDVKLNEPVPVQISKMHTDTYVVEDSLSRDEAYWNENRLVKLDTQEINVYEMVDSVTKVPMFNTIYSLIELFADYYYVVGPLELGPYYTVYSYNPIEGHRFRLGGRTSKNFSTKYRLGGHIAYGTLDEKVKYGVNGEIMFDRNPRRCLTVSNVNDMRQLGKSQNAFLDDNILSTILRRKPNYKLTPVEQYNISYEHEWFQGFSNTFSISHQTLFSTEYVPFTFTNNVEGNEPLLSLTTTEVNLNFHFAYREKFLLGKFERKSLGSKYPILDFDITYSPEGILDNKFEYYKLKARISDKIEINPFGHTRYWLTAGKIFGQAPYPFLELHDGNETYAYDMYAFNMMNYYEFASDAYISLAMEQHFQGFFFNKIPLLRRLEWREVVSAKAIKGSLCDANKELMALPENLNELTKPYVEAGIGVENILKLFRIEATWRLAYLNNPDIQIFGLRAMIQLTF
jgi:hypothetical protein